MSKNKSKPTITRKKSLSFSLSDKEYEFLASYIKKYKIGNRTRWLRETVITHALQKLDQDHPTLFDENEMRR